jgi:hypothetical protein
MSNLQGLKKTIFADGRIDEADIVRRRKTIFDTDGITKEKADFLFELKNPISRKRMTDELKSLFVEAITAFLLEDEESPGKIDDNEAKWLRAKNAYRRRKTRTKKIKTEIIAKNKLYATKSSLHRLDRCTGYREPQKEWGERADATRKSPVVERVS